MSHTLDILSDIPHGTVDGYRAGCHGSAASCGADVSCAVAFTRYQGDWGFRKRVDAGESPASIIAAEGVDRDAVMARDKAANRRAKADGAAAAVAREKKRWPGPGITAQPSLTDRIVDDVRRLSAEKKSAAAIARELGVSKTTVTRARRAAGLRTRRMQIDRNEITRLHGLGWNDTRIADHLDVSNSSISAIRRHELGLPKISGRARAQPVEGPRARRRRLITEMHARGMTDRAIADELGVDYMTARQARNRYGLPLNPEPSRKGVKRGRVTQERQMR